ncbi:hypothetical protein [Mycoplasmopsis alligatoris]|uniref:Lipoprotein n=1 Tax=Mycoplasmopsis alligatoris A21JP2 TaxID=747682 RepID=D4XW04_9BACT|nr:hypothetical protein [Mycoplasmopsis alligatoris]EFF41457.1 hypothetical protein MALL_0025 [Mycoplasmopsis alligatoris A21JP2]
MKIKKIILPIILTSSFTLSSILAVSCNPSNATTPNETNTNKDAQNNNNTETVNKANEKDNASSGSNSTTNKADVEVNKTLEDEAKKVKATLKNINKEDYNKHEVSKITKADVELNGFDTKLVRLKSYKITPKAEQAALEVEFNLELISDTSKVKTSTLMLEGFKQDLNKYANLVKLVYTPKTDKDVASAVLPSVVNTNLITYTLDENAPVKLDGKVRFVNFNNGDGEVLAEYDLVLKKDESIKTTVQQWIEGFKVSNLLTPTKNQTFLAKEDDKELLRGFKTNILNPLTGKRVATAKDVIFDPSKFVPEKVRKNPNYNEYIKLREKMITEFFEPNKQLSTQEGEGKTVYALKNKYILNNTGVNFIAWLFANVDRCLKYNLLSADNLTRLSTRKSSFLDDPKNFLKSFKDIVETYGK